MKRFPTDSAVGWAAQNRSAEWKSAVPPTARRPTVLAGELLRIANPRPSRLSVCATKRAPICSVSRNVLGNAVATALGALLLVLPAKAAEVEWKAGVATVRITPETPVPMAGYAA